MKRVFYACAAWVLLVGLTGPAQAQYTYTALDVPGATATYGYGINDAGQIVGSYVHSQSVFSGFLLDVDGSYTPINVPGAYQTWAYGINGSGQIVGVYDGHGFLATPGG